MSARMAKPHTVRLVNEAGILGPVKIKYGGSLWLYPSFVSYVAAAAFVRNYGDPDAEYAIFPMTSPEIA